MDVASPSPECTFTSFPKLPAEIRQNIWSYASFLPRNIDLWATYHGPLDDDHEDDEDHVTRFYCHRHMSLCPHPAVLHTSREARSVALKRYELSFGTHHVIRYGSIKINTPARIYINWGSDVILPMAVTVSGRVFDWSREVFCNPKFPIQNLALNISDQPSSLEHRFGLLLHSVTIYEQHAFQLNFIPIYRHGNGFGIELVGLEQAKTESPDVRKRTSRNERLLDKMEDLPHHHHGVVLRQEVWDEWKANGGLPNSPFTTVPDAVLLKRVYPAPA